MPQIQGRIQGRNLISEITEKSVKKLLILSGIVIFIKLYRVKVEKLTILGLTLPPELFNDASLVLKMHALIFC